MASKHAIKRTASRRERVENFIISLQVAEMIEPDNGNVHRAAAKVIVSKSRAARGSVCNVLLCRGASLKVLCHAFGKGVPAVVWVRFKA